MHDCCLTHTNLESENISFFCSTGCMFKGVWNIVYSSIQNFSFVHFVFLILRTNIFLGVLHLYQIFRFYHPPSCETF